MSNPDGSTKSILYALGANFTISIAKGVAAVITNSGAMFAEAIHSLADCTNQVLLLLGLKRAKRPPSDEYPLGYGKEIYFWSFIVAILLFSVGGMFSLYEGIHKLQHPEALNKPFVALGVLIFAIFAEGLSLIACIKEINRLRGDQNLWRWFRTSRRSALIVIFGEELAALLGLVFACVAITASWITGDPFYDAVGTIGIGVLLIIVAVLVGREVKDLLVGQGVEDRLKQEMQNHLTSQPGVEKIFNIVTLQLGNDVMVAVKARVKPGNDTDEFVRIINAAEVEFKKAFPQVMWLFFEPDIRD